MLFRSHFVGITTSISVMLTFLIAITIMPIMLSFGKDKKPLPVSQRHSGFKLDCILETFGSKVLKWRRVVWVVFILVTAFLLFQMTKIETTFDVELNFFDFSLNGNFRYNHTRNTLQGQNNLHTFNYGGGVSTTLYLPYNFSLKKVAKK